jgi:hypothetical protein
LGTIHDNNVHVKEAGNPEGGSGDSIAIQARFGAHDIQVYNNTVTLNVGAGACPQQFYTDTGSNCGGIGVKLSEAAPGGSAAALTAYNNTVSCTSNSSSYVCAALYPVFTADSNSYFKNNNVTSNSILIASDPPGSGSGFDGCAIGWLIQGNTFTKAANPQGFYTYGTEWYCTPGQTGGDSATKEVFLDNIYNNGASPDDLGVPGYSSATYSYYVKWSYNVTVQNGSGQPLPGATVTAVSTGGGTETVSQITDAAGKAQLVLTDHYVSGTSATSPTTVDYTPHTIKVAATGCTVSVSPFQLAIHQTTSQTLVCQ